MSKQEKKWREEFSNTFDTDEEWQAFSAAKRQDAERIAELEARLDHYTRISEAGYSHGDYLDQWVELTELRAKLDALEKQEPIYQCWQASVHCWQDCSETVYHGCMTDGYKARIVYAKPVPTTPAIPEGWQLVPKEADSAMLLAGKHTVKGMDNGEFESEIARCTYLSMLLAAPRSYQLTKEKCDDLGNRPTISAMAAAEIIPRNVHS